MSHILLPGEQCILERKRINELFETAKKNSVFLITGGSGCGKTCAVNNFLVQNNKAAIWLSLTERDDDPPQFWESIIKAVNIQSVKAGKTLEEIGFPETRSQISRCMSMLNLSKSRRFVVVIDNLHHINNKEIINFLNTFLASPYRKTTTMLISLTEPELNIMNLFSKGLLLRITVDDLRFNIKEIILFFKLKKINLSLTDAKKIYSDTHGWIIAISLIADELKKDNTRQINSRQYSSSLLRNGNIRDMIQALFDTLPPECKRFLVTISVFDSWPLEVLTGISSCVQEQADAFKQISALFYYDIYLHGFTIHPLFLDFLKEKQASIPKQEIQKACSIKAAWCLKNRLLIDAAFNYGMAGDYDGVFKTIYSTARIMPRATAGSFFEIIKQFVDSKTDEPNDKAIEEIIENTESFLFLRHVTKAVLLLNLGRYDESKKLLERSISEFEKLPSSPQNLYILSSCYNTLGILGFFTYRTNQDISNVEDCFKKGDYYYMQNTHVVSGPVSKTTIGSYANLVGRSPKEGEFEYFIKTISKCIPYAVNSIGGYLGGGDSLCKAELAFFKGEINAAEQYALEAVFAARKNGQHEIESKGLFYLLRISIFTGDNEDTDEVLNRIEAMLELSDFINRYVLSDIINGWFYAQLGIVHKIAPWLRNEFEYSGLNLNYQNYEIIVKAKSLFSEKRYEDAGKFIQTDDPVEGLSSYYFGMLELTAFEAVALLRIGNKKAALCALQKAYEISISYSIVTPFIELGKDMKTLANAALSFTDIPRGWLEGIKEKASAYAKKVNALAIKYGRAEKENPVLTAKEITILKGISRGYTRAEIANNVSCSLSTVKKSIKTIYSKLGAINRADAIRIANNLCLFTNRTHPNP